MLRAVSTGAAFLLFLGGRRVSNECPFFRYSFVGCARQRCVWRFFGVLLRIARGKGVLSKPFGTAARAVRGSCEAVRLFLRSLRGRCAAKAGLLCFAVFPLGNFRQGTASIRGCPALSACGCCFMKKRWNMRRISSAPCGIPAPFQGNALILGAVCSYSSGRISLQRKEMGTA